jgi:RNA polymerase sigma-70 factor (ECF subfamily)
VRAILRDDRDSEDVMQQAYVNAYAHLRQFDRRAAFSTWLTRIAVNEAIARARKQGRYEPLESEEGVVETLSSGGAAPDPERLAFARELAELMEAAVDELPDGCREVFVLREIQGMSTSETADVLEVSEDVVKTRLSRAKATLRRDLLERAGLSAPYTFAFHQSRCDRVVQAVFERMGATN